jgi:hypothetical protein
LIAINTLLLAVTFFGERIPGLENGRQANVQYERLDLIVPERRHELIADLEQRTGWIVRGFEVGDIDFLKDIVQLRVMYQQPKTPRRQRLARDWRANATD